MQDARPGPLPPYPIKCYLRAGVYDLGPRGGLQGSANSTALEAETPKYTWKFFSGEGPEQSDSHEVF